MRALKTRSLCVGAVIAAAVGFTSAAPPKPKHQVLFNRFQAPVMSLFIADGDGANERALLPAAGLDYSPSFSADGQWVVYTSEKDGQPDIYRIAPDGTGLQRLTDHPAFDDQGSLSPDGTTLAFVSTREGGIANIWLMDLASKKSTNLTKHHSGNFRPSWSPDGRWIAFTSDRDSQPANFPGMWEHLQSTGVYVIRADGRELRRLTRKDGVAGSPSWSADGRRLLFYETDEVGAYLAKSGNSRTEIASIDMMTGERKLYTASNETKLSPRWLSDGRISYIKRAADDTAGLRIWHPSRRVDTLIRGAVRNASWAPGGRSVVYERIARHGSTQHLVPALSTDADFELLLSEPFPSFSLDGTKLLYSQYGQGKSSATGLVTSATGNTTIEVMSARGDGKRTLFHRDGFSAFSAVWSPAGDEIALSVGRYFRAAGLPPGQIGLIKPDGSRLQADRGRSGEQRVSQLVPRRQTDRVQTGPAPGADVPRGSHDHRPDQRCALRQLPAMVAEGRRHHVHQRSRRRFRAVYDRTGWNAAEKADDRSRKRRAFVLVLGWGLDCIQQRSEGIQRRDGALRQYPAAVR